MPPRGPGSSSPAMIAPGPHSPVSVPQSHNDARSVPAPTPVVNFIAAITHPSLLQCLLIEPPDDSRACRCRAVASGWLPNRPAVIRCLRGRAGGCCYPSGRTGHPTLEALQMKPSPRGSMQHLLSHSRRPKRRQCGSSSQVGVRAANKRRRRPSESLYAQGRTIVSG
jgi:hypothetical protein